MRRPEPTENVKMMFLIQRRAGCSREELVAHWFANHMPEVIRRQLLQASAGKPAASRYLATVFDDNPDRWDGVAQLWFEQALPRPDEPFGTRPTDSFQERAEPYSPWATREYVVIPGELPVTPLTLNEPFPTSRSGFLKITYLVRPRADVDLNALYDHWLDIHLPAVVEAMQSTGGFRYVVSHSLDPHDAPYAGMAELYFPDEAAWQAFAGKLTDDGIGAYIENLELYTSHTEFIGIP